MKAFLSYIVFGAILAFSFPARALDIEGEDEQAIERLYQDYSAAWLLNTEETQAKVMALFAEGATIIPSGGKMIFNGHEELKGFWFPPDAPPATVDQFEQEILKVSVDGNHGALLGWFKLKFAYETEAYYTEGYNVLVAERGEEGWRITTMMWNHPAWEVVAK